MPRSSMEEADNYGTSGSGSFFTLRDDKDMITQDNCSDKQLDKGFIKYNTDGTNIKLLSDWKEKAKTSEELYREYAQSGMTLNDFALSVGISRTTLWRKFKNINSENKNETRNN